MLKLRKNKKGFTLVELIVVIAIMAVLAGTVAGVTVSQLNKNTDKANQTKAKQVADFVAGMVADPDDFAAIVGEDPTSTTTPKATIFLIDVVKEKVKDQFGETYTTNTAAKKGEFFISLSEDKKSVVIQYEGKANGGSKTYKVSMEGVIS